MMRPTLCTLWILPLLLCTPTQDLIATTERFTVSPPAQAEKQIKLTTSDGGSLSFTLARREGELKPVDISVSPLRDDRGNSLNVTLKDPARPNLPESTALEGLMHKNSIAQLLLQVPAPSAPGPYSGELFVTREGQILDSFTILLSRTPLKSPAALVVEPKQVDITYTRPLWGEVAGPSFTIQLRETSGEWPLYGIAVRPLELKGPQGVLEPQRALSFTVDGVLAPLLWQWPRPSGSVGAEMPPSSQTLVEGLFQDLGSGEYTAKLRFTASNIADTDKHEVIVSAKIKDSPWIAVFYLTIAIIFSYLGTKGLTILRERATFRTRIDELRARLNRFPHVQRGEHMPIGLPEVRARAALRQAQDLSHRWVLSGIEVIRQRVDQAERVITLLERVTTMSDRRRELPERVRRRFDRNLGRIVRERIGDELGEEQVRDIEAQLNTLESWFQPDALPSLFHADLEPDIARLLNEIRLDELKSNTEAYKLAQKLVNELEKATPPGQKLTAYLDREDQYAMLQLIWTRRNRDELDELVSEYKKHQRIDPIFDLADQAAWARLKESGFKFVAPKASSLSPLEAYKPVRFEIEPKDRSLTGSWLFKHGLRYEWELTIEPQQRKTNKLWAWLRRLWVWLRNVFIKSTPATKPVTLEAVSTEPRIVQFSPFIASVTPKVTLYFGDEEPLPVTGQAYDFQESSDFRWRGAFETAEIIALLMAWIVAVITGLKMFYFDSAVFGSAKDYVLLFLWGAGADQVKNFVQALQSYSGKTSTPANQTAKAPET